MAYSSHNVEISTVMTDLTKSKPLIAWVKVGGYLSRMEGDHTALRKTEETRGEVDHVISGLRISKKRAIGWCKAADRLYWQSLIEAVMCS